MQKNILYLSLFIGIIGFSCQNNSQIKLASGVKVLTNQVGYDSSAFKQAIVSAGEKQDIKTFNIVNLDNDSIVYSGKAVYKGPVAKWKNWQFWTLDFSDFTKPGKYYLQVDVNGKTAFSYPFNIQNELLERNTLSDVIYYFKGQRSSGQLDKADKTLAIPGGKGTVDLHGGWYDATGDYGIHFTQLSFTSYFNTQQVPLVAWSMYKSYQELESQHNLNFSQYERRLLGGGVFGADFLYRMHIPHSSFYTSISAPGAKKLPEDRRISVQIPLSYFKNMKEVGHPADDRTKGLTEFKPEIASFRAGGGMAIAALALASTFDVSGDFSQKQYLSAAEDAFDFLQKNNLQVVNDGKENILDDYCALLAATELYIATKDQKYMDAANTRANNLMNRLVSWNNYKNYWSADDKDRPFFHPSDAGLPVVSLIGYYKIASADVQKKILDVIKKSMQYEISVTDEVTNPFGYARELVTDTTGKRYTAFFFPHNTRTGFWWQGDNARIASLAAAARMAAPYFKQNDPGFYKSLQKYAWDQLNWILGLNPFDVCMLDGHGHKNPEYNFLGTFQYTTQPGGIVNGITSGMDNPDDIDFDIPYSVTGKDNDWRWVEQWLPHAAWYMVAVSVAH